MWSHLILRNGYLTAGVLSGLFFISKSEDERRCRRICWLIIGAVVLTVYWAGLPYGHYWMQIAGPASVLAGLGFSRLFALSNIGKGLQAAFLIAIVWVSLPAVRASALLWDAVRLREIRDPGYEIAAYLKDHGAEDRYVFITRHLEAYLLSGARIPTRFANPGHMEHPVFSKVAFGRLTTAADGIREVTEKKPKFIVIPSDGPRLGPNSDAELRSVLRRDYFEGPAIDYLRIYERKAEHVPDAISAERAGE
jgi:hypothetical protein